MLFKYLLTTIKFKLISFGQGETWFVDVFEEFCFWGEVFVADIALGKVGFLFLIFLLLDFLLFFQNELKIHHSDRRREKI
jgi:hypothetical protein